MPSVDIGPSVNVVLGNREVQPAVTRPWHDALKTNPPNARENLLTRAEPNPGGRVRREVRRHERTEDRDLAFSPIVSLRMAR